MWFEFITVIAGFIILVKSADLFVEGSVVLAKKIHVEEVIIGITLVALGTSLPELFVNLSARQRNLDDALVGNVLGSSIFNILMILGLQISISPLMNLSKKLIRFDLPLALLLGVLLWIFALFSLNNDAAFYISSGEGYILTALYVMFILKQYRDFHLQKKSSSQLKQNRDDVIREVDQAFKENTRALPSLLPRERWVYKYYFLYIILGIVGLYFGSDLTVEYSVKLARNWNLSEAFIGVFLLSVGTSLPELVTTLVAIRKKYNYLALGNVLGSNICNIGLVLAVFSWINPISYNPEFHVTFMILIGVTSYLFFSLLVKKKKSLVRMEGILMVLVYLLYVGYSYCQGL